MLNLIKDVFSNYMLVCGFSAWLIAQLLKIPFGVYRHHGVSFRAVLFGNGGMPSSHSATVCAITCAAALNPGLNSPAFAICCILSIVVMNDAVGVRRETGEQAKILNKIVADLPQEKTDDIMAGELKELVGHTPFQVLVGALLGVLIPLLFQFIPWFGLRP